MAIAPPQIPGLADWRPVARGGFSLVWEARQESLNRLVAVKVDRRRLDADSEQRRFLREAGAAGRLSGHPGIVTVHDAGILGDDRPFLVMELCPGGSLTRWLEPERRPTQRRVRDVGVRIADALAAAHSRGVLHRDVKPANILIDAYDNPGLADFGLAALPDPDLDLSATVDSITPAYAPPEVFHHKTFTEFGDVYSLAATLYALLRGRPPRWPEDGTPTVEEMLELQRQPITRIPGVVGPLMDVLLTALADDPAERPTAAQFRDRLAAVEAPDAVPSDVAPEPVPADPLPEGVSTTGAAPSPAPPPPLGPPSDPSAAVRQGRSSAVEVLEPVALPAVDDPSPARSRRALLTVAVVIVVLLAVLAIALANLRPSAAPQAAPPPVASTSLAPVPTPTVASPSPGEAVPDGYRDCSGQLGEQTYCAVDAECWAGIISLSDLPALGTPRPCDQTHVYQTFVAGRLPNPVRRQSDLEADPVVQLLCRAAVANGLLRSKDQRSDWEILALPPQESGSDDLFRCLVGHGERSKPLKFR